VGGSRSISGSRSRSAGRVQAADFGGSGRIGLCTVLFNIGLTGSLTILAADVGLDAVAEKLLADKGRHSLGVVLKTRSRAVESARAVVREISLVTVVVVGVGVAKQLAGVGLALAPNSSLLLGDKAGVDLHVERAGIVLDLSRHRSGGNSDEDGGKSHFENGLRTKHRRRSAGISNARKGERIE